MAIKLKLSKKKIGGTKRVEKFVTENKVTEASPSKPKLKLKLNLKDKDKLASKRDDQQNLKDEIIRNKESVLNEGKPENAGRIEKHDITWDLLNDKQKLAAELGQKESFVLIGEAGSGKTTTQRIVLSKLEHTIGRLSKETKHMMRNAPAVAVLSFTNKAVENIRDVAPESMKSHCLTIHKFVEYTKIQEEKPVFPTDAKNQVLWGADPIGVKTVQRYVPGRNKDNKLPHFDLIIVEESSNVSVELFQQIKDALPNSPRWIFIGDIFQLKPPMGYGILGFAMANLPVVALDKVYRTGEESMIKPFGAYINRGLPLSDKKVIEKFGQTNSLKFKPLPKRISAHDFTCTLGNLFRKMVLAGKFVGGQDLVMTPFSEGGDDETTKSFGCNTRQLNLFIAQGFKDLYPTAELYPVKMRAGYKYFMIGDEVFFNKRPHTIIDIAVNPKYKGTVKSPSMFYDRWGTYHGDKSQLKDEEETSMLDLLDMDVATNQNIVLADDYDKGENQCSHVISVKDNFSDDVTEISSSGDLMELDFAYCLTPHKAQGSEYKNTYILLHHSHAIMASREWLYTAVTRTKDRCTIFFDGDNTGNSMLSACVDRALLKGITIEQKLENFKALEKVDKYSDLFV